MAEKKKKKNKKQEQEQTEQQGAKIIRVGDIQDDISDEELQAVISMYMPRRRIRLLAKSFLRMDKLRIIILLCLLFIAALFIMSFMQEKMGNFTINLDRLELYRKGISIAEDAAFTAPTARLSASPIEDATNISINDLPDDLAEIDGDHNGTNYVAYTYYIRNSGKEDVNYTADIQLNDSSKGAEEALRVAVWRNDEKTVYAAPAADGGAEEGCTNFLSDEIVCQYECNDFLVGNVDKYTIVIWLEGDDPECVDAIVGGSIELSMKIAAANDEDMTLLQMYIKDIIDTIRGNKPISAAGSDSPDSDYSDVTWDTRRNQ